MGRIMNKTIPVLDHGLVELVDWMGGDLRIVNSAKGSYGKRVQEVGVKEAKLIQYMGEHKHGSPFRHAQFCFFVKAPEFIARQWYKHIVGASYTSHDATVDSPWNELSLRYTDATEIDFYYPEVWRQQSKDNKQSSFGSCLYQDKLKESYDHLINQAKVSYRYLIHMGVAREQARMVLPLSFYTEFYWTCSLQAVANFIKLRDSSGAQEEIQIYARILKELVDQVAPESLAALLK